MEVVDETWSRVPRMSLSLFIRAPGSAKGRSEGKGRNDERECFHDEVLYFVDWHAGVRRDHAEGNHTVRGWSTEDGLDEGHEADLLTKESVVGLKDLVMGGEAE